MADDHELVRQGVASTLERVAGFQVIAQAANGDQALRSCAELQPGIIVLDINMPGLSGIDVLGKLPTVASSTRAVVLSMESSEEVVHAVLMAGANAYVLKSDAARDLTAAVSAVAEGRPFFTPAIAQAMLSAFVSERREQTRQQRAPVTDRESQVIREVAQGKSNKQIAARLGISIRTVETHRSNIMEKIGAHSVAELVLYAVQSGLLPAEHKA